MSGGSFNMSREAFDLIVIGGGAGGVPAAIRASQLGGRVAIVEQGHVGGLCMNRGCIPFRHMMAASHILGSLSLGQEMGIQCSEVKMDYTHLMKRQAELIAYMRQGVQGLFKKHKVSLFKGRGKLKGPGAIAVDGTVLLAPKIILAGGGKWLSPAFPGGKLNEVLNSDDLLKAKKLPEKCLVYGNSPLIVQIAQFLQRFGCDAMLVIRERSFLSNESKAIRTRLKKVLIKENIRILTDTRISGVEKKKSYLYCHLKTGNNEKTEVVDRVIVLNRGASLGGLGLDTVGLDETAEFIVVDAHMKTAATGIYAIGDVAAPETNHYSHSATAGGIVAAENAMGLDARFDTHLIPRVSFTRPQMVCIGLTKKAAKKTGYDVIVGSAPLSMNPFGMLISQNEGIVEIISEKKYGEILGIHILGEGACEMAGQAVLAMQMEMTLEELAKAQFPHPTLSESLPEAARDALGWPIYLP
jgi:dihydrolipoamide dehydrogenase